MYIAANPAINLPVIQKHNYTIKESFQGSPTHVARAERGAFDSLF